MAELNESKLAKVPEPGNTAKVSAPTFSVEKVLTFAQAKTKAKKRYLKAKKDRRKQRKSGPPNTPSALGQPEEDLDEHTDISDDAQLEDHTSNADSLPDHEVVQERPKKRRKLNAVDGDSQPVGGVLDNEGDLHDADEEPREVASRQAGPALPSFPLPRRPDAPSKASLALQGQDKALIQAVLIEPRTTAVLDSVNISDRTRKRLNDLGIQELFAGMYITKHAFYLTYRRGFRSSNSGDSIHTFR